MSVFHCRIGSTVLPFFFSTMDLVTFASELKICDVSWPGRSLDRTWARLVRRVMCSMRIAEEDIKLVWDK